MLHRVLVKSRYTNTHNALIAYGYFTNKTYKTLVLFIQFGSSIHSDGIYLMINIKVANRWASVQPAK
ncbi:hypothetical protein CPI40_05100 [Moraxella catarrhalis]|nr:hypothetical protein [Moraxella catarrhalis]